MMNFGFGTIILLAIKNVPKFIADFVHVWFLGGLYEEIKYGLVQPSCPQFLKNFLKPWYDAISIKASQAESGFLQKSWNSIKGVLNHIPFVNKSAVTPLVNGAEEVPPVSAMAAFWETLKTKILPFGWKFYLAQALVIVLIWLIYRYYLNKRRRFTELRAPGNSAFHSIMKILGVMLVPGLYLLVFFILPEDGSWMEWIYVFLLSSIFLESFSCLLKNTFPSKLFRRDKQVTSETGGEPVSKTSGLVPKILWFVLTLVTFVLLITRLSYTLEIFRKSPDFLQAYQSAFAFIFGLTLLLKLFVQEANRLYINLSSLTRRINFCIAAYESRLKYIRKTPILLLRILCLLLAQEFFILFFAFLMLINIPGFTKIFGFMLIFEFALLLLKYMFPNLLRQIRLRRQNDEVPVEDDDEMSETTEESSDQAEEEYTVEEEEVDDTQEQNGDSEDRSSKKSMFKRFINLPRQIRFKRRNVDAPSENDDEMSAMTKESFDRTEQKGTIVEEEADDSEGRYCDTDDRYLKKILIKRLINLLRQVSVQRQIGAAASRNDDEISETTKGLIKRLTNLFRSGKQK